MDSGKHRRWYMVVKTAGIALIFLLIKILPGQAERETFFNRVNSMYYNLDEAGLQNFSSWLSSNMFRENTKDLYDEEVYPLEFIWTTPDQMFFIRRAVPEPEDTAKAVFVDNLIFKMQSELKGLLIDWQRFYGDRILADLPPEFEWAVTNDTIIISYQFIEQSRTLDARLYFGINGICLKTIFSYRDEPEEVHTYPEFKFTGSKWLCTGWKVQIYENKAVSSGYYVNVISQTIEKFILPVRMELTLQTVQNKDQLYIRIYDFRNLRINRDIQIVN